MAVTRWVQIPLLLLTFRVSQGILWKKKTSVLPAASGWTFISFQLQQCLNLRFNFNLVPFGSGTNTSSVKSDSFHKFNAICFLFSVQEINMDKSEQLHDLSVLRCLNHGKTICFIQVPHQCLASVNDHWSLEFVFSLTAAMLNTVNLLHCTDTHLRFSIMAISCRSA